MSEETREPQAPDAEGADAVPAGETNGEPPRPESAGEDVEDARYTARLEPKPPDWLALEHLQRRIMVIVTALLAATFLVGATLAPGPAELLADDEVQDYFAYLPSIVLDRDLELSNQFAVLRGETHPHGRTAAGSAADPVSIVPALLWMPGYMCGVLLDRVAASLGLDTGRDGYGAGALWGAALSSLVLAGLGAELSRRLAAQLRGPEYGLPAALFAWLGTAAITYTLTNPLHPQSAAWFCAALMMWLSWRAFRVETQWMRWAPAGVAVGLLLGIRPQDAPLALIAGAFLLLAAGKHVRTPRAAAALLAGAALGYLPAWLSASRLAPPAAADGGNELGSAIGALSSSMFSLPGGWITATPIVGVGLVGLGLMAFASRSSVARRVGAIGLIAAALMVLLDAAFPAAAGSSAGLRLVAATPLLILGLTQLLADLGRVTRRPAAGLAALLILTAVNLWMVLG